MAIKINPETSLIKRLCDDLLSISLIFDSKELRYIELYTNVNRSKKTYQFESTDNLSYRVSVPLHKSGHFFWKVRIQSEQGWKWLVDNEGGIVKGNIQVDPKWLSDAIVYNVFVRFFSGKVQKYGEVVKPGDGGTFDDVKKHLDKLKDMGITVLYFNPIHLIGEVNRKYNQLDQLPSYLQPGSPYSIKDYKSIDPELTYDKDTKKHLGSDPQQEFRDLINAAHDRGIYVFMDIVFNHTAHDFVFQRIRPEWYLYKDNILSIEEPFLYPEDMHEGKPWGDPKHTMAPYDHGIWWEDAAQLNWEYMIPEASNKPPKNTSLAEMWEYFKSIPQYWINHFGVDGFRCDIAYRVPTAFWKACIAEARETAYIAKNNLSNDVVFVAEAYTNNLRELQEAGFSAVYGDYSHKLSSPLDLKGYLDYMYNINESNFPDGSKWFIFPESHDFGRTPRKVLGDKSGDMSKALLANQSRWLLTATLPGIPLVFNGFEKIEWEPINLFSYGAVDWERDVDLRIFIEKVNAIRHRYPSLQKGDYRFLPTNQGLDESTQIFAYLREYKHESIIVVINMDVENKAGPAIIELPEMFDTKYKLHDVLNHTIYNRSGKSLMIELEPGQAHVFVVMFSRLD